jgi:transcriptional regulator with XRE-family HTH domain
MPRKRSPDFVRSAFGARLELARTKAELTIQALADVSGCPPSTLSTAERSGNGSTYIARIALACGVSPIWLETGVGEMHAKAFSTTPTTPSQPQLSTEGECLAFEFDEAPLGRTSKAQVYSLCLAIIKHGGLPAYAVLVNVKLQK